MYKWEVRISLRNKIGGHWFNKVFTIEVEGDNIEDAFRKADIHIKGRNDHRADILGVTYRGHA
jgi:hypothetical protein